MTRAALLALPLLAACAPQLLQAPEAADLSARAGDRVCWPGKTWRYDACATLVSASGVPYRYPSPLDARYAAPVAYLDLHAVSGSTAVAPNFVLSELAESWKGRWAVVQVHAVERLQSLRDRLGPIVVNSGYRSPSYNAQVGGATWSRHMYGDAFDLDALNWSSSTLANACWDEGAGYVSTYADGHVHCDWRNDAQERTYFSTAGARVFRDRVEGHAEVVAIEDLGDGVLVAADEGFDCGEPTREWVALDADGEPLAVGEGPAFEVPEAAVEVELVVGGFHAARWAR